MIKIILDEKDFIPLTNDILFKDTLSQEKNIHFLEQILETFLECEKGSLYGKCEVIGEALLPKNKLNDKSVRGDVIVKSSDNIYDLEMYNYYDDKAEIKSFLYLVRLAGNVDKSEDYTLFKSIIGLNFINNPKKELLAYDEFEFLSNFTGEKYLKDKDFKIKVFNLDKIEELDYNKKEIKRILSFLKARSFEERNKIAKGDKCMEKFNENVNKYTIDENTKELFYKLREDVKDQEAYYQGEEDGIKKGIKQGIEQEKIDLCRKMKNENINVETISKISGLSIEEIEKI